MDAFRYICTISDDCYRLFAKAFLVSVKYLRYADVLKLADWNLIDDLLKNPMPWNEAVGLIECQHSYI